VYLILSIVRSLDRERYDENERTSPTCDMSKRYKDANKTMTRVFSVSLFLLSPVDPGSLHDDSVAASLPIVP